MEINDAAVAFEIRRRSYPVLNAASAAVSDGRLGCLILIILTKVAKKYWRKICLIKNPEAKPDCVLQRLAD
jgi:hypothetical protein